MYLSWEDTPDTPDTPSKSGLKWWGILLIVLSVIFVLALGVIGFMKYKESETANQSRLLINWIPNNLISLENNYHLITLYYIILI